MEYENTYGEDPTRTRADRGLSDRPPTLVLISRRHSVATNMAY
jgi:hypothetical protein